MNTQIQPITFHRDVPVASSIFDPLSISPSPSIPQECTSQDISQRFSSEVISQRCAEGAIPSGFSSEVISQRCAKGVILFTTKFAYYLTHVLSYLLEKNGIPYTVVTEINPSNRALHILPFCQKIKVFPPHYIIYQLEQKDISKWIDARYEMAIALSVETWDYSMANIMRFSPFLQKKIKYVPIPLIPFSFLHRAPLGAPHRTPLHPILFYGSMNPLRTIKLDTLNKKLAPYHLNVHVIRGVFGKELFHHIRHSTIILNIHFYEGALLETYRINEALSCEKIVISEYPNKEDVHNYKLYKNKITFVQNMEDMANEIVKQIKKK